MLSFFITFFLCFAVMPVLFWIFSKICPMVVVHERECLVYELWGKVVGRIDEPGLHFLVPLMGLQTAWLVGIAGTCHVVDLRLDQQYLRSLPVNSEEGAPMGIGVWYEMFVSDPEAFLFKNTDPSGSLRANVNNATVRCLSNLSLASMMETRHQMSNTVRNEVSPHSHEWGYKLGSVYIRKVHFRDRAMMRQIEEKVVNRLRQVTGAINQDGANQVDLIRSSADRQAAVEFAKASAVRPEIVGSTLREISQNPEVAKALFEVLEMEKLMNSKATITLLPKSTQSNMIASIIAANTKASSFTNNEQVNDSSNMLQAELAKHAKRTALKQQQEQYLADNDFLMS